MAQQTVDRDELAERESRHYPTSVARAPRVSVCIVNRDCRAHLERCLRSLLTQPQGVDFEVIVVDNGSTDGAPELVRERFPGVRLVRNVANLGFARANNQAAENARGEHLFFLNNDTIVPPGTLAELVEAQENHPETWLIGPRLRGVDGAIQRGPRRLPTLATFLHRTCPLRWTGIFRNHYRRYCREGVRETTPQSVELLMGAALWTRRDRFEELGGWDEDFFFGGEDLELCLRAARHGVVLHVPHVEIVHVGRVSTRLFIGQASVHIAVGFAKYLRKKGTNRAGMFAYKCAVTLDAPLQMFVKAGQIVWRAVRGQWAKAGKCWNEWKGLATFVVRGLWAFWRA